MWVSIAKFSSIPWNTVEITRFSISTHQLPQFHATTEMASVPNLKDRNYIRCLLNQLFCPRRRAHLKRFQSRFLHAIGQDVSHLTCHHDILNGHFLESRESQGSPISKYPNAGVVLFKVGFSLGIFIISVVVVQLFPYRLSPPDHYPLHLIVITIIELIPRPS